MSINRHFLISITRTTPCNSNDNSLFLLAVRVMESRLYFEKVRPEERKLAWKSILGTRYFDRNKEIFEIEGSRDRDYLLYIVPILFYSWQYVCRCRKQNFVAHWKRTGARATISTKTFPRERFFKNRSNRSWINRWLRFTTVSNYGWCQLVRVD